MSHRVEPLLLNQAVLGTRITGKLQLTNCRLASTANVVLGTGLVNGQSIDGTVIATGDRILLKNQTAPAENGIYLAVAAGTGTRALDSDEGTEFPNTAVLITAGATNASKVFSCDNLTPPIMGTTSISYTDFTGALTGAGLSGQVAVNGSYNKASAQVQYQTNGTVTTATVTIQGRATPESQWMTLDTITQADALVNGTKKGNAAFFAWPFMRAWVSVLTGGGSVSVWLDVS
jgi:hypothetical protein